MIDSIKSTTTLNNGVEMPWLGLGTWQSEEGVEVINAIKYAVQHGYRSIDTASLYANEVGVGKGIKASGVVREELFITTKVWNSDQGYDRTLKAFEASLKRMELDYVDLYLVHWPVPGKYLDTWRALETIYENGQAKAIGVSNFHIHHLKDLFNHSDIVPAVNQVECHPRLVQNELITFCKSHNIQFESWAPIMQGKVNDIEVLKKIGKQYGKTPVQVTLRWNLDKGIVTIPKSVKEHRLASNADIFDFSLTAEDIAAIDALDKHQRIGPDPDNFDF